MVGSFKTYRGFVYLTPSGDTKNYGSKKCRYRGGDTFSEKRDFDLPVEISISYFCLRGGGGGGGGGGGRGTLRRLES